MVWPMSIHAFVFVLTCGAALLALWILARFIDFGPQSIVWAAVHLVIAMVLLRLVPYPIEALSSSTIPAARFVALFGLALPMFVYIFLSGGWVTRLAMGRLRH
jgi:hypothetical protein